MVNILASLVERLKTSKLFIVFLLVAGIGLPILATFINVAVVQFVNEMTLEELRYQMQLTGISGKSLALSEISITSIGGLFALICAGVLACYELKHGPVKNCILAYGRKNTFFAHALFVPIVFALLMLADIVGTAFFMAIPFGWTASGGFFQEVGEILCWLLLVVIVAVATGTFANTFIIAIKSATGSIFAFLGAVFAFDIVVSIILLGMELSLQQSVIQWLPLYQLNNLISKATILGNGLLYVKTVIVCVAITGVFGFLNWLQWQKVDFK